MQEQYTVYLYGHFRSDLFSQNKLLADIVKIICSQKVNWFAVYFGKVSDVGRYLVRFHPLPTHVVNNGIGC